jgi:pseudouridine synthase
VPDNRFASDNPSIRFERDHLKGLAPAGRLDIDSTGLLVFTQDGRIAKLLIGEDSEIEKEYLVRVEGQLDDKGLTLLKPRTESRRCATETGQGHPAESRSIALRAARRQEATDPAHV